MTNERINEISRQQYNRRLLKECAVLIPHIENALALLPKFSNVNPVYIIRWVKNCNVNLSTLNKVLETPGLTTQQKQRCLNIIRQITYLSARFDALSKRGKGVESNNVISNRVRWGECDAAFKRQLQTGVIINFIYKGFDNFLNNAFSVFAERVREEQITSKSFIAKTREIFSTTL